MNFRYPVVLSLKDKNCLVVGGGEVAFRKVTSLLDSKAQVKVISPELHKELQDLVDQKKVTYEKRNFNENDLADIFLVIGATNQRTVNSWIGKIAQEKNLLVNIVDQPEDCNFIVPAIHRAGDLSIAITTHGKSPALAGKIRRRLSDEYSDVYEIALDWLGEVRKFLLSNLSDPKKRRKILIKLADFELVELLDIGQVQEALETVGDLLEQLPKVDLLVERLHQKYIKWSSERVEKRDGNEED